MSDRIAQYILQEAYFFFFFFEVRESSTTSDLLSGKTNSTNRMKNSLSMGITAYTVLLVFCLHIIRDKNIIKIIFIKNAIHKLGEGLTQLYKMN